MVTMKRSLLSDKTQLYRNAFNAQGERNFHVLYELIAGSAGTDLGNNLKVKNDLFSAQSHTIHCRGILIIAQNNLVSLFGGCAP